MRSTVDDIDRCPKHLMMLSRLAELEQGVFKEADVLATNIVSDPLFSPEESKMLAERVLPFFEPFRVPSNEAILEQVSRLEAESYRKAGIEPST